MNKLLLRVSSLLVLAVLTGCGDQAAAQKPAASSPAARASDGSADVAKGLEALEQNDPTAAMVAFTTAATKCATNFEARLQLALVKIRLGDVPGANAAAAEALALCPESAEANLADGQAAYLKRDYKRALADFDKVAKEQALPPSLRSDAWVGRGVVELAQSQTDAARLSFLRAKCLDGRNPAAWYHLGVLYRDALKFNHAAYEQFQMASGYMAKSNDERARKISRDVLPSLRKAIAAEAAAKPGVAKRDPVAAAKLLKEGQTLQSSKRITAALKKYEAAYAADPLSGAAALAFAHLRGLNAKTQADVDKALAAFRAASDQDPSAQAIYREAALLAYKHARWSTAAAIMDRAVAHDPVNKNALDLFIAALKKSGKGKLAESWQTYRGAVR